MRIQPTNTVPARFQAVAAAPEAAPAQSLDRASVARSLFDEEGVTVHPVWSRSAGAASAPARSPEGHGPVVVLTRDGSVQALSPETGEPLWSVPVEEAEGAPVVGTDGTVYVASGKHHLVALDGDDGQQRWSREFQGWLVGTPAVSAEGTLGMVLKDPSDQVLCLDAATGETRWQRPLQQQSMLARSVAISPQGTILAFENADLSLRALDGHSGRTVWKFPVSDYLSGELSLGDDGSVYVSRAFGDVLALDSQDGRLMWKQKLGKSPAATAADGAVFVRTDDNRVSALDARTGQPRWQQEIKDEKLGAPRVDPEGNVVVTGGTGTARALDAESGQTRWTANLGGGLSAAVAGQDDEVFFSDASGRVVGLHPQQGGLEALAGTSAPRAGAGISLGNGVVSIGGVQLSVRL